LSDPALEPSIGSVQRFEADHKSPRASLTMVKAVPVSSRRFGRLIRSARGTMGAEAPQSYGSVNEFSLSSGHRGEFTVGACDLAAAVDCHAV